MTNPQSPKPNRRTLLRTTGLTAAALATMTGATLASPDASAAANATSSTISGPDNSTLLYLLLFKYVTATYYLYAATGQGLSPEDTVGTRPVTGANAPGGAVLGGAAVPFQTPLYRQYAENIAADEQTHVRYLRTLLGGIAGSLAMPTIDMSTAWTNLAITANLIVPGQTFNPFADEISFLLGAYFFEDLCVSAESGFLSNLNAGFLSGDQYDILVNYIGGLSGADAYHAGTIRTLLARIGGGEPVAKISAYRASLSGTPDTGILMPNGAVNIGPFGSQALMLTRTFIQGFEILFAGADLNVQTPTGGFFPNGLLS